MTTIIIIIIFLVLISVPIFLFLKRKKWNLLKFEFISYLFLGMIISAAIISIFNWWTNFSNELLLSNYGYDFDAMNDTDRFRKVAIENLERVKQIEISQSGIGWPLKAIFMFIFYSPYLLLVYLFGQLIIRIKRKNKVNAPG